MPIILPGAARQSYLRMSALNEELLPTLSVLMDNPNKLKAMRAAMFQLSHPRAAEKIASALIDLVGA